ncbi:hypothetical protein LR48_Vigan07g094800 [Vigna angularis]|uniref:BHLH domain-containing protein n=2 Tax=Phaseolus angularis TaxID=3914 RepID=A0A0L9UXG2_PHAAN|nr:transcription factor bHLH110 isoform X1 [Vigna angularis]KOM47244.1 hypothetical protein LR48_Vigan07g094800 [Vigna angularis]
MSEASSYSTDLAKMRNALLSSVSSRLHSNGIGNDEVQLEFLAGSMQMNDLTNFLCNGFNMESRIFKDDSQMGEGVNTQPSQSQSLIYDYNHQPGSLYAIPSIKDIYHHSLLLDKDPSSQYERVCENKRPFEYTDNMSLWKKMRSNPKSKITIMEPKCHQPEQDSDVTKFVVAMRRNPKLSDKVTTLQKLVSPFGKTDTSSVLHEASHHIKLLQAQIRTLFQMLSFSYINTIKDHTQVSPQEFGDKLQIDLNSRGLCLVPVSVTEKVKMVDQIHLSSASSNIIYS